MSHSALVLDQVLPRYDVSLVHARVFQAPPEKCLATLVALDVFRHPIIQVLITARGLPLRILGTLTGKRAQPLTAGRFTLSTMVEMGWVVLADRPGAELVLGQVSRPWRLTENAPATVRGPEEFRQFSTPGYAKIATGFRAEPDGEGSTVLTVESRILLTDEASRRRFMRYWLPVRLGSEIIRRLALRMLARELSAGPDVTGTIEIAAPIDRVFDTVADERNEPLFNPRMATVDKVTPGPLGVGATFHAVLRRGRRNVPMEIEYTAYERPRLLASTTRMATMDIEGTLTLEPVAAGTRMGWAWRFEPRGMARVLRPVMTSLGGRQEREIWAGLRDLLENGDEVS